MDSWLDPDGSIDLPFGSPRFNLANIIGPFFLGICFACFGTGIVFVLAIRYVRYAPSSRWMKGLVYGVLFANLAQSAADISRGWHMFAESFLSIQGFLTPHVSFFISPFFGLFPTTFTQLFLLRRSHRFLTSLEFLFPTLAHPITRTTLATTMILGILLSFGTGTGASWEVYRIGNLAKLGQEWPVSKPFHKLSRIWLFSSSIVDACLAVVLCWELWWAREKLTAKDDHEGGLGVLNKGKGSNGILLRLIVITLHGGIAVTAIQISALALMFTDMWTSGSFAYMLFISIPKVYSITLLLSLSVPQASRDKTDLHIPQAIDRALDARNARNAPATSSRTTDSDPLPVQAFPMEILSGFNTEPASPTGSWKDRKKRMSGIRSWFGDQARKSHSREDVGKGSMEMHTGSLHQRSRRASHDDFFSESGYPQPFFRDSRRPSEPNSTTGLLSPSAYTIPSSSSSQFGSYPSTRCVERQPLPFPSIVTMPPPSRPISRHHFGPTAVDFDGYRISRASSSASTSSRTSSVRRPSKFGAQQLELGGLGPLAETMSNGSENRSREVSHSPEQGLVSLMDMLGGDEQEQTSSPKKKKGL